MATGSFAVPGMLCADVKGSRANCEILETDNQGRILFYYETFCVITQKKESSIVICQKYESDYVYFYEDICYLFSEWTDKDIEELKKQNDWNCPLDFTKMSRRHYSVSFDLVLIFDNELDYPVIYAKCMKEWSIDRSQIKDSSMVDIDSSGKNLIWILIQQNNLEKQYIILVDQSYNIQTLEITEVGNLFDELPIFKKNNGWVYGY